MTILSSRGQACAPRQIPRQTGSLGLVDGHVARGGVLSNVVEMPVSGGAFTNSEIADALAKAPESLEVDAPKPTPSPSRMRPRTRPGTRFPEVLDVHLTAQCLTVSADMVYELFERGDLPGWKVGRTWLLTKAAVLRWLEASTTQSMAAAQDAALARAPAGSARGGLGKRPWAFPPHDVSCGAVC